MNIIIPLGGKGERFSKNGYTVPKPLIQIFDKTMIEYVLDNLNVSTDDKIFIIYNGKLDDHNFSTYIHKKYYPQPYILNNELIPSTLDNRNVLENDEIYIDYPPFVN